jgi:hypothetical protein
MNHLETSGARLCSADCYRWRSCWSPLWSPSRSCSPRTPLR